MRRFIRKRVIAKLRAEGWHLVKTPEWIERRDPMRFVQHLEFRAEVDEWMLSIREEVSDKQIVAGPTDLIYKVRERMVHGFAESLLRRLA